MVCAECMKMCCLGGKNSVVKGLSAHAYKRENGVTNEAIVIEWAAAGAW